MAVSSATSAASNASLRLVPNPNQELRDQVNSGRRSGVARKQDEDRAQQDAAAAAGVGSGAQVVTTRVTLSQQNERNASGSGVNGVSGSSRPTQAKTVDQAVSRNQQRGAQETSYKAQLAREERQAVDNQRDRTAETVRTGNIQRAVAQQRELQNAQAQRSPAAVQQVEAQRQQQQATAAKAQNVEIKKVEQPDARQVNAQAQAERVQRNQESAQTAKYQAIADAQLKSQVKQNETQLKSAVSGPTEAQRLQNLQTRSASSNVGQNINVRA